MIVFTVFTLIILLFSIIIHEIAHGSAAFSLGDPTAKSEGRLTLNPLKHIDLLGSIILPLFFLLITAGQGPIFGWAKPVPINPYNFRDRKWGMLKVSIAGPATNFLIAIIFGLLIRYLNLSPSLFIFFSIVAFYNFLWGLFNLVPIPPLDGSWILFNFLPEKWKNIKMFIRQNSFFILIIFFLFGLPWLFAGAKALFHLITGGKILPL